MKYRELPTMTRLPKFRLRSLFYLTLVVAVGCMAWLKPAEGVPFIVAFALAAWFVFLVRTDRTTRPCQQTRHARIFSVRRPVKLITPKRRWAQFSLPTLFLVVTMLCVGLALPPLEETMEFSVTTAVTAFVLVMFWTRPKPKLAGEAHLKSLGLLLGIDSGRARIRNANQARKWQRWPTRRSGECRGSVGEEAALIDKR
jgi:DMSO/TMAO reductase YedYZ heme-binding membrane subunit